MNKNFLTPDKDPMGAAIADYFSNRKAGKLRVLSSMFDEDEIPVKQLFRGLKEMQNKKHCTLPREEYWMWEVEAVAIRLLYKKWVRLFAPLIYPHSP